MGVHRVLVNQLILADNLGNDPEIFFSGEGETIAAFDLAFHSTKKKTGWIRVVCFKKLADVADKYLHKGARVAVTGNLDQNKWEADDGTQRSTFQLIANNIEFIKTDGRGFENGEVKEGEPF